MGDIRKIFLTQTISDFLAPECNMSYIKFVFDKNTLMDFINHLDPTDLYFYNEGLKSIKYLVDINKEYHQGKDDIYIKVHDSNKFFSLLEKLIYYNSLKKERKLRDFNDYIRSIWLRMSPSDIDNVEGFLEKQLKFLKNDSLLPEYKEITRLNDRDVVAFRVKQNDDWFETNQNITFSIRRDTGSIIEDQDYDFPAIHYGFAKEDGIKKCYIYGIQLLNKNQDEEIREDLQPIRKTLRNKYVSPDFIISLSLFLDYLYDQDIKDIEIPTLQVFNYPYHEHLSSNIKNSYDGYSEEDKTRIEKSIEDGEYNNALLDYIHTKSMVSRFVDKQDDISRNKTERFIEIFQELMRINPSIELLSTPFMEGENLKIHLSGKTNILKEYQKKERTY